MTLKQQEPELEETEESVGQEAEPKVVADKEVLETEDERKAAILNTLIADIPGLRESIDKAKAEGLNLMTHVTSEDEIIVIKVMTRLDHRKLRAEVDDESDEHQEELVKRFCFYPDLSTEEKINECKAGLIDVIGRTILIDSGFLTNVAPGMEI